MGSNTYELWTIKEAAEWLRISVEALRCRLKRGQFPKDTYTHLGRAVRFIAPRLREWVLTQPA